MRGGPQPSPCPRAGGPPLALAVLLLLLLGPAGAWARPPPGGPRPGARRPDGGGAPAAAWPRAFEQAFTERNLLLFKTKGRLWYDYEKRAERVDRDSGLGDRYCGTARPLRRTPCQHIVTGGVRYLNFPKDGVCCKCCTDAGGCGILNADWLDAATFRGEDTVRIDRGHSVKALKFEVDGLQSNFFWQRPNSDTPVRLLQSPNDDMLFSQDDFARGPVDDKVFELPPGCGERRCGGICSRLD